MRTRATDSPLHIDCVDRAEKATIDALQSANVPKVCNSEGNVALHLAFGGRISARARAVLDAADNAEDEEAPGATATAPPDLSPLSQHNCVGRRVLVPCNVWPAERCDENNGQGWSARVLDHRHGVVTIHFINATTARGLPYENVQLQLTALRPL